MPTIRLIGRRVQDASIPATPAGAPPPAPKLGDQFIFTDDVAFRADPQPKVGEHSGFCTVVRVGPGNAVTYQCEATFTLPDGQITARGAIDSDPFTVGISGGTRKYRKVRGQVRGSESTGIAGLVLTRFNIRYWR